VQGTEVLNVGSARMRMADKELLSLALIDARNQTLRWAAGCEVALGGTALTVPGAARGSMIATAHSGLNPPLWQIGHIGWFQEYWIARNVRRQRGERGDATAPKLASILPEADRCFDPEAVPPASRWAIELPALQTLKQYLFDTLETTLELLTIAADEDEALHFYRLALFHEDQCAEAFAELAQSVGFDARVLPAPLASTVTRPPLLFPATRWRLGSAPGGFVFDNEKWSHDLAVPEFEIDAQAVNWAQYGEFVEDGGYDERHHWSEAGWAWVQMLGRRTPRHVEQMRQGVLLRRFGHLVRVPQAQPVVHVSWFEAEAWCRWAGRRLPSEVEWEAAAVQGASRGLRWGDVWEWTSNTFRAYPGAPAGLPGPAAFKAQRGASFATAGRLRHPKARRARAPDDDTGFCGFRSCSA
jgi:iron(II)-dependent oxidoreductase